MSLSISKIRDFLIYVLILLVPLAYSYSFYNPYELPKFLVFIFLVGVMLIIGIILLIKRKIVFPNDFLTRLVIFYLWVNLLADIFGLDFKTSILGSEYRHQGLILLGGMIILFFVIKSREKDGGQVIKSQKAIAISNILTASFALYQIVSHYCFNINIPLYNGRIVGTMGNPNSLAGYLAITLPFVLNLDYPKISFLFKILFTFLNLLVIYFTGSRAGLLIFLFVLLGYNFKNFWRIKEKYKAFKVVLFIIFLTFVFSQKTNIFFVLKNSFINFLSRNSIYENRLLIWSEGLKAVKKRPILGYGQENFELIFPKERHMKVDNAHNLFLEILISSGITGLIVYLLIIFEVYKRSSPVLRSSLIAFLTCSQFNPLSIAEIMIFWILVSMAR